MQHVDRIGQVSGVNHAEGARFIPDANFLDTLADLRHRLEVIRLLATLYQVQLATCVLSRVLGKIT